MAKRRRPPGQQQQPRTGLSRAMRGLRSFAASAEAAYGKLNSTMQALIPVVRELNNAYVGLREAVRSSIAHTDAAASSWGRVRLAIGSTIPLVSVLSGQFVQLAMSARGAGTAASSAMTGMAGAAGRAAASGAAANAGLLATLGPLALIAAAAGTAYVAMFKWESVPALLKPILLILSPMVLAIRLVATAWDVATLPVRAFTGAIGLATSAVKGTISTIIALPGYLATATASAIRFGVAVTSSVVAGLQRAASAATSFATATLGAFVALGGAVKRVGTDIYSSTGPMVERLTRAATEFGAAGTAAIALASSAGMAVSSMQAIGYAAEQSGSSIEEAAGAAERLNQRFLEIQEGVPGSSAMLQRLGLDVERLQGMSAEQRFEEIGIAIASLQSPLERAEAATALFGSSSTELIDMFSRGRAGLAAMRAEAERLGLVMSDQDAAAAKELTDANRELQLSLTGIWRTLGAAVAPQLAQTARDMATLAQAAIGWIKENRAMIAEGFRLASIVAGVGSALITAGTALATLTPGLVAATGALAAGWLAWGRYGSQLSGVVDTARRYLGALLTETERVMGGVWAAIQGGDIELAVGVAWAGIQKAWVAGLSGLATITGDTLGGILNALASGDWSSALNQAWGAIKLGLSSVMQSLDEQWTALQDLVDNVITSIRQGVNTAISEVARLALSSAQTLAKALEFASIYDPTGTAASARQSLAQSVRDSGLVGLAGSPDAANAALEAGRSGREFGRASDLAGRSGARGLADSITQGEMAASQQAARANAETFGATIGAKLEEAIKRAEAARDAANRGPAAKIDQIQKLAKDAESAMGGTSAVTFSGAALLALGGRSGPQERAAAGIEKMVGRLDALIKIEEGRAKVEKFEQLVFTA